MTTNTIWRLDGFEPNNLLAFLALLGLLRALEASRPTWRPRAFWTVDAPPIRPSLCIRESVSEAVVVAAVAEGLGSRGKALHPAPFRRLDDLKKIEKMRKKEKSSLSGEEDAELGKLSALQDLKLSPEDAVERLEDAAHGESSGADLWASLITNAAVRNDGFAERTPLCLLSGQGHQHFLSRLARIPQQAAPPPRGMGHGKTEISEAECLREALFAPWTRSDATSSFRWDPHEDVRYALRATDPTDSKTKERTQHGANRLAAIGLPALTVVPQRRAGRTRLRMLGGKWVADAFVFTWPIWRDPMSLVAIRSLLGHPGLDDPATRQALGIVERRRTRRISSGKFMNFTKAISI